MELQPHQQRVVDEKTELDARLTKLNQFIAESPIFKGLDDAEKSRLIAQKAHMEGYSDILGERIRWADECERDGRMESQPNVPAMASPPLTPTDTDHE